MTVVVEFEPYLRGWKTGAKGPKPSRHDEAARFGKLSSAQHAYLARGLAQPGGKLPLFDREGQRYANALVRSCLDKGWAEPWFANPIQPDWLVCKLTPAGRKLLAEV